MVMMFLLGEAGCWYVSATEHYLRLGADAGYARNMAQTNSNGAAGGIDFGYRMEQNHFLLDVGLGGQYWFSRERLQPKTETQPAVDNEGMNYTRYTTWSDRDNDMHRASIFLPVMVGGQWYDFYFLVGGKANLTLWGQNQEKGLYSVAAGYDRYIGLLHSLPQYGWVTDVPYSGDAQKADMEFDLRLAAEVSYKVASYRKRLLETACYVGLFAEYGILNPKGYTPFEAGVRVTVLWQMPKRPNCMCDRH